MVKEPSFSSRLEKPLTTAQYVADYLRKRMLSGEICSGDRLKQNHLAQMLGVSSTPVREALRDLAAEGLVRLDARSGCVARGLTFQDAEDIYTARLALEPILLKRNFARITPGILEECETINEKMRSEKDLVVWARLNNEFHMKLLGIDYPSRMTEIVQQLFEYAEPFVAISLYTDDQQLERSYKEHCLLLEKHRQNDLEATIDILYRHQKMTLSLIERKMQDRSVES